MAHQPSAGAAPADKAGAATITTAEFEAFRRLISRVAGIHMSDAKRRLVETRLTRRLRHYGYATFKRYYQHLKEQDPDRSELREMVNCITTNKTSFFRESHHFDFLRESVLGPARPRRPMEIWSAGCSTGQEAYSIAMAASSAGGTEPVNIVASDIDTRVLETAREGVYGAEEIEELPAEMQQFFLTGQRGSHGLVRVRPELQAMVDFRQINLNAPGWDRPGHFDVIFCRNVIIYFSRETQRTLLRRFAASLRPGGYLILGHSENIQCYSKRLVPRGDTIYRLAYDAPADTDRRRGRVGTRVPDGVGRKAIRIEAGGVHASNEPTEVRTLLGSCVSVCLYDPVARTGGMNHFMLPAVTMGETDSARYGVNAMELLINEIMRLGGERSRLRAKVFGGAQVLRMQRTTPAVATLNIDFVRGFMRDESIPMEKERLGGKRPLEVRMQTDTGMVMVRALDSGLMPSVVEDEVKRTREVVLKDVETRQDDVVLF